MRCLPVDTGCFCNGSTILLEEDGEVCIAPDDCPVNETQECPEGKVYNECGTACPLTCDNKDDDIICTKQCVAGEIASQCCLSNNMNLIISSARNKILLSHFFPTGCFCPEGYVEKDDSCILPDECDLVDLCSLPPLTGPCKGYFPKYFFNSSSGECEQFIYGGCQGNDNNFNTVEDCEAKCNGQSTQLSVIDVNRFTLFCVHI